MRNIHLILTGLSLTIILLSLNRLTNFTLGYLAPNDFLRWVDFNAMLPIPLLTIILYFLLKREIVYDSPFKKTGIFILLNIVLAAGIYFFGAGSGDHEVTNYLNTRFCDRGTIDSPICNIIKYNDDEFSHYIYYLGFILLNISLMFFEYFMPRKTKVSKKDLTLIFLNSLFIALGIFANLAFEEIGIDLYIFASVALLATFLLFKGKEKIYQKPILFYFFSSYTLGVISTFIYKSLA